MELAGDSVDAGALGQGEGDAAVGLVFELPFLAGEKLEAIGSSRGDHEQMRGTFLLDGCQVFSLELQLPELAQDQRDHRADAALGGIHALLDHIRSWAMGRDYLNSGRLTSGLAPLPPSSRQELANGGMLGLFVGREPAVFASAGPGPSVKREV